MILLNKYKNYIISIVILTAVLLPSFSFAQGLVPCSDKGDPCTLCHLYKLAQNIIGFMMWYIAPALAIFIVAWGGFNILIAGGDPGRKQAGRKAITAAIVGLLIVFGAWIIINEFLLFFSGQASGIATIFSNPWTDIQCK